MKNKIILALDVDTLTEVKYFINKLYPRIKIFKVGPRLLLVSGPKAIELIHKKGGEVFLDLKFLDIPNTVTHAVRQAVALKVKMLTLHISGGEEMIKAAVRAARDEAKRCGTKRPLLLGVTVLTSRKTSALKVLKLARQGLGWGLDGIVCSVQEAAFLRKKIKSKFIMVTPGIRPSSCGTDDQKRTATSRQALLAGSDFLVVGRPILQAADPVKVFKELVR